MPDASQLAARVFGASPVGGRYHAQEVLGRGAHGVVVAANDAVARRAVALKVATDAGRGPLINEARALSHLNRAAARVGPTLHGIHDHEALGAVVVMEHIHGASLTDWPPIDPERLPVATVAQRLLEAVARTHDAGIVHGDLKPEHVLLARERFRLVDFGLACSARGHIHAVGEPALEFALGAAGSPAYLAPERFLGWPPDEASDLYAIGAILFELLTGRALVGEDDDLPTARHIHLHEAPPWPARRRGDRALVDVVTRCLEKDPWRRPRDARDALSLLRDAGSRRRRAGSE